MIVFSVLSFKKKFFFFSYGRKLLNLSNVSATGVLDDRGAVTGNDIPVVVSTWETLNRQVQDRGARGTRSATEIDAALDELENWQKDQVLTKKKLSDEVYRFKKELSEGLTEVSKAQSLRDNACAECDKLLEAAVKAQQESDKGKAKDLKQSAKSALEKATKLHKDYVREVQDANKFRVLFNSKHLPDLIASFRKFDEARLVVLRTALAKLCTTYGAPTNLLDQVDASYSQVGDWFGSASAKVFEVIPYDANFTDFTKSRSARLNGTEELASVVLGSVVAAEKERAAKAETSMISPRNNGSGGGGLAPASSTNAAAAATAAKQASTAAAGLQSDSSAHFEVMPNSVVALGVESKREILRAQLAQLQTTIEHEKGLLQEMTSLLRFYGRESEAYKAALPAWEAQTTKFKNFLGARKQIFVAMEKIGTQPSVFSTLPISSRYSNLGYKEEAETTAPKKVLKRDSGERGSYLNLGVYLGISPREGDGSEELQGRPQSSISAPASVTSQLLVRAMCAFNYKAASEKELSFKKGEILIIRDEDDSGWWYAENDNNQLGFVPANYVRKINK